MSAGAPLLGLHGLVAGHDGGFQLAGVDGAVAAGQALAVLGVNGAGKSTLLKAIVGLLPVAAGRVVLAGRDIAGWSVDRRVRDGIGYVPEGRRVFAGMSVLDNLRVPFRGPAAEERRRLDQVFALFPDLAARSAATAWRLSGGQQQMLAIGRALMGGPRVLLLDEPWQGLAPLPAGAVAAALRAIQADGVAVVVAEDRLDRALAMADRLILLRGGRVVHEGSAKFVCADAIAQALLGGPLVGTGGRR